jgi:membrane dipeptidase
MAMTRRNFLEAGLGGAALSLAQAAPLVQSSARAGNIVGQGYDTAADLSTVVIGVDGSSTKVGGPEGAMATAYIDLYLSNGATVWQYSDNIVDLDDFANLDTFVAANSSKIILAKSYNDILAAKRAGKVAMVVGMQECTPFEPEWFGNPNNHPKKPNNWDLNPPTTQLSDYYDAGLRLANLAYNLPNFFGGGCLDDRTPLSSTGEFLVQQMQEMGILVDCSHSSEQTALDVISMATRPVVCSHSNVNALDDNPRNISDRVIKGIADTSGLIGVNAVSCFLTWSRKDAPFADNGPFPPPATIKQYVDVMDYIRHLVGIDHVGIGSDFDNPQPQIAPPPSQSFLYPPEMTYNQPHGLIYVTNFHGPDGLPFLRAELVRRGYSSVDIAKILGGNWMRIFREAWNA